MASGKPLLKEKDKPKKQRKPKESTWRNKATNILTPVVIKLFPRCLLCNQPTQVAHHHVHKSKSNRLRYELINLINLCHKCHQALHHSESYYASKIVSIKGIEWFNQLEKMKQEIVKTDVYWHMSNYERLKEIYERPNNN